MPASYHGGPALQMWLEVGRRTHGLKRRKLPAIRRARRDRPVGVSWRGQAPNGHRHGFNDHARTVFILINGFRRFFGTGKGHQQERREIMALERTFSIIKPDATRRNLTGKINAKLEDAGLRVVAQRRIRMTQEQAETFYGVHKERSFFPDLVSFMTSGPVVVQVLEGEDAIAKNREVMGATNPANADEGTIRKEFAESIEANSVHGSDSPENAEIEINYFFAGADIVG